MQGLLAVHQYYINGSPAEQALAGRIDTLWREVDWNFYRRNDQNVLYWHWSPEYGWEMNFPVHGYNECLIMYILAAASPTHSIPATVYHEGWAEKGAIVDPHKVEDIELHLRYQGCEAGPLFWAHYSFLGLDPTNLSDKYCPGYFNEMRNLTLINRAYCIRNPKQWKGFGPDCWGTDRQLLCQRLLCPCSERVGRSRSHLSHCRSFFHCLYSGILTGSDALSLWNRRQGIGTLWLL